MNTNSKINKELLKFFDLIGAYEVSKFNNTWFIPQLGEKRIYEYSNIHTILESIYESGQESGKELGKKELIDKFKKLLEL